jgi:uncharacterized protein YybS (DUF2232 family)
MNSQRGIFLGAIAACIAASAVAFYMTLRPAGVRGPWWFIVGMVLAALNGLLVAYMIYRRWSHGTSVSVGTLNTISRILAWATLAACAAMIIRAR